MKEILILATQAFWSLYKYELLKIFGIILLAAFLYVTKEYVFHLERKKK